MLLKIYFGFCCVFIATVETSVENNEIDGFDLGTRLSFKAERAKPNEFPYEVSIQQPLARGWHHFCGGALISTRHVLTAAHCLTSIRTTTFDKFAGVIKVWTGLITKGEGQAHEVRRIAYHRGYVVDEWRGRARLMHPNDIGVLTLREPVTLSKAVQLINLPPADLEVAAHEALKVAGWGNAVLNGQGSEVLLKTTTYCVAYKDCYGFYQRGGFAVSKSQICAQRGPGYNVCQGDSGSPLTYRNMVVGIVSTGSGECEKGHPDVYTKVSKFIPFIEAELGYDFAPGRRHIEAIAVNSDDYLPSRARPTTTAPRQQYPPASPQAGAAITSVQGARGGQGVQIIYNPRPNWSWSYWG